MRDRMAKCLAVLPSKSLKDSFGGQNTGIELSQHLEKQAGNRGGTLDATILSAYLRQGQERYRADAGNQGKHKHALIEADRLLVRSKSQQSPDLTIDHAPLPCPCSEAISSRCGPFS